MSAHLLVLAGYGLNCEEETLHGFNVSGVEGKVIHINDLVENPNILIKRKSSRSPAAFPTAMIPAPAMPMRRRSAFP